MDELKLAKMIEEYVMYSPDEGVDEYYDVVSVYPECIAKKLSVLGKLFGYNHNIKHRICAKEKIQKLLDCAVADEKYIRWGLPFRWHDNESNDGFLITTSFCIDGLMDWYDLGETWLEYYIAKAVKWCLSLLLTEENGFKYFIYAPNIRENIYNAASIACGVLLRCKQFLNDVDKSDIELVIEGIIQNQKNGYWNYSNNKSDVDLIHQCYTVEGLLKAQKNIDNSELSKQIIVAIRNGLAFLDKMKWENMERYLFSISDNESVKAKLKHGILKILYLVHSDSKRFAPPRAWSVAAYIRLISLSYCYSELSDTRLKRAMLYFCDYLLEDDGNVRYSAIDCHHYIRHTSHAYEAIATMLFECVRRRKD